MDSSVLETQPSSASWMYGMLGTKWTYEAKCLRAMFLRREEALGAAAEISLDCLA